MAAAGLASGAAAAGGFGLCVGRRGSGRRLRRGGAADGEQRDGGQDGQEAFHVLFPLDQSASAPVSPVRMRTTCSSGKTKILPSPILPVRAAEHW
jgi:hypothetical protein